MPVSRRPLSGQAFTPFGWVVCIWVLVLAFQYGYHISVLNQIQAVLTCKDKASDFVHSGLSTCIPMSELIFSVVTAVFTVGGLIGSLSANLVMDSRGRKSATTVSAICTAGGTALMGLSNSVTLLGLGRFFVGVGSGFGLCVGPVYLAEIAPSKISGSVGVLTQLGIVLGIMITQAMGLRLASPTEWRIVLFFSFVLSAAQVLSSIFVVESPVWLGGHGRSDEKKAVAQRLWGSDLSNQGDEDDPLLNELEVRREDAPVHVVTVPQLFVARELWKPLAIISLAMASQQLSGINAVLYYSNNILAKSFPNLGPYISLGVTVVNVLMTFPPIILIERMGRKQLLVISAAGAVASLLGVGYGLNRGLVTLSSIAIVTFIMAFAIGLGPIPFVMISEVSPSHAVSALSSVALSINWIINFWVGLIFLPVRDLLAGNDVRKQGRVFYVFAVVLFSSTFTLSRIYR